MHANHVKLIISNVFHDIFVNQDADPFLYSLYERWTGCSRIVGDVMLKNHRGGDGDARYTKQPVRWTFDVLQHAVQEARAAQLKYLEKNVYDTTWWNTADDGFCDVALDVAVPSYRCDMRYLQAVFNLPVPVRCITRFILIIDNPTHPSIAEIMKTYEGSAKYRIRVNEMNRGTSHSRNRCIYESSAEYIFYGRRCHCK
jgi:hypothetical protein